MSSLEVSGVLTPSQTELVKAWWKKVNSQQTKGMKKTIAGKRNEAFFFFFDTRKL
jgi:hypothetical protein